MREVLEGAFADAQSILASVLATPEVFDGLIRLSESIIRSFQDGAPILIAGNGGSMADAMHFAEEWTGRFRANRRAYPVLALSDPTYLTCVANDFGFDEVFARGVQAFGKREGLLILLTTSGQSRNLLRAAEVAQEIGMTSVALVGRGGGALLDLVSFAICFPGETSDRIQELQMLALHAVIEATEPKLVS